MATRWPYRLCEITILSRLALSQLMPWPDSFRLWHGGGRLDPPPSTDDYLPSANVGDCGCEGRRLRLPHGGEHLPLSQPIVTRKLEANSGIRIGADILAVDVYVMGRVG